MNLSARSSSLLVTIMYFSHIAKFFCVAASKLIDGSRLIMLHCRLRNLDDCLLHILSLLVFDEAAVSWVIQHLILHRALQEHVLTLPSADLGRLLLNDNDFCVQLTVLSLELIDTILVLLDIVIFFANDSGQVLELLHLLQVLITLLIDRSETLLVSHLHVRQRLLQVQGVSMAGRQGISKLRSQLIHVVLGVDAHLALMMELMLERHVLLVSDRLVVLCYETAQHVELVLKLAVLDTLHFSFLGIVITLNLQVFNFSEQVVDAARCLKRVHRRRSTLRNWLRRYEAVRYLNLGRSEASFTWARYASLAGVPTLLGGIARSFWHGIASWRKRLGLTCNERSLIDIIGSRCVGATSRRRRV